MQNNIGLIVCALFAVAYCGLAAHCADAEPEKPHPALLPPIGRDDFNLGATITKWDDVVKLGKLWRDAKGSEAGDAYFYRLLAYFKISTTSNKAILIGMKGLKRSEIEAVFGKGHGDGSWNVPRGTLVVTYKNDICIEAEYNEGF